MPSQVGHIFISIRVLILFAAKLLLSISGSSLAPLEGGQLFIYGQSFIEPLTLLLDNIEVSVIIHNSSVIECQTPEGSGLHNVTVISGAEPCVETQSAIWKYPLQNTIKNKPLLD